MSDEAILLSQSLNIPVIANPDRIAGATQLLREFPQTDVILLDDAFQHQRAHRDLNIVLIDATNPFGYSHVLPRGMLREPLAGLRRADLFILTHCDQVTEQSIAGTKHELREFNTAAPIVHSSHRLTGIVCGREEHPLSHILGKRVFCFCGIGNPQSFHRQILLAGAIDAGATCFDDHHHYTAEDMTTLADYAARDNAEIMITTEKDWVKIEPRSNASRFPICRARMELSFSQHDADLLLSKINAIMAKSSSSPAGRQASEVSGDG